MYYTNEMENDQSSSAQKKTPKKKKNTQEISKAFFLSFFDNNLRDLPYGVYCAVYAVQKRIIS